MSELAVETSKHQPYSTTEIQQVCLHCYCLDYQTEWVWLLLYMYKFKTRTKMAPPAGQTDQ